MLQPPGGYVTTSILWDLFPEPLSCLLPPSSTGRGYYVALQDAASLRAAKFIITWATMNTFYSFFASCHVAYLI